MQPQSATQPKMHPIITTLLVVSIFSVASHAQYNQYFGASNYFGMSGMTNQGYWHAQSRCPWGTAGYRGSTSYQCGTFSCPSMWFGTTTYSCPMGTLYSNSLQMCVSPSALAGSCRRRVG